MQVFVQIRGTKGKLSKQHLTNKAHADAVAVLHGENSVFKFAPGTTENFAIRGPDVSDLVALEIEVIQIFASYAVL